VWQTSFRNLIDGLVDQKVRRRRHVGRASRRTLGRRGDGWIRFFFTVDFFEGHSASELEMTEGAIDTASQQAGV
jgi:hypothetical protein